MHYLLLAFISNVGSCKEETTANIQHYIHQIELNRYPPFPSTEGFPIVYMANIFHYLDFPIQYHLLLASSPSYTCQSTLGPALRIIAQLSLLSIS